MAIIGNRRYDLSTPDVNALVHLALVRILKDIDGENKRRFYKGSSRRAASHHPGTSFKHSSAQKAHVRVALGLSEGLSGLDLMHVQNPSAEMEIAQAVTAYHQLRLNNDIELFKRGALEELGRR